MTSVATYKNRAAYLDVAGQLLQVRDAPLPVAGPDEIVVKNSAVAINPLDCHMQDHGVFVQQWPAILGSDVAGEVHEVGDNVTRFKKGDRVVGHAITLVSGRPQDGAFAWYTVIPANKAAILPASIPYTEGAVLPLALEGAVCALFLKDPAAPMPGITAEAFGLPLKSLFDPVQSQKKTLVIHGGSSSIGAITTQMASAAGVRVISILGAHNIAFSKQCGAEQAFDRNDPLLVDKVYEEVKKTTGETDFIGIFDAISIPDTYSIDLEILNKMGGGRLVCTHPPPSEVPKNIAAGMIFPVNDIATSVWEDYVTHALESERLRCLPPPFVVGHGLKQVQKALKMSCAGVSAKKLVVDLSANW